MSYHHEIAHIVSVVEGAGAGIMILGGSARSARLRTKLCPAQGSYETLRRNLGRCMLLGHEVLIVADNVQTISIDTTIESIAAPGITVIIRIPLSSALEVEIDGAWPWLGGS